MKILIQHRHSANEISGVMTYINLTVSEIAARGIEYRVISTRENSMQEWLRDIAWADLVHMNSNHLAFAMLCKLLRKKIVLKYHYLFYQSLHSKYQIMNFGERIKKELIYSLPKANYPLKWKLHTIIKWARLATRLGTALTADNHIACSNFLAESLAFPRPVSTIYNPIQILNDGESKSLANISKPYYFIFVGRLAKDKGVDILLKSSSIVKKMGREFQVLVVGDGSQLAELKQLATDLDIADIVQFLGQIPNIEVIPLVSKALALVAPSRWQDPAPYVLLEAASVQTCPIGSRIGGIPEMVGLHGLLFDSENIEELAAHMAYCLDNPEDTLARGLQVNKYVENTFSPSKTVEQLINICQKLG